MVYFKQTLITVFNSLKDCNFIPYSYERIQDFFKKIEGSKQSDVVVDKFESMMRSLMKEFNGLQTEITSLKDSLEKYDDFLLFCLKRELSVPLSHMLLIVKHRATYCIDTNQDSIDNV